MIKYNKIQINISLRYRKNKLEFFILFLVNGLNFRKDVLYNMLEAFFFIEASTNFLLRYYKASLDIFAKMSFLI